MYKFYNKLIILSLVLSFVFLFFISQIKAIGLAVDPARLIGKTNKNDKVFFVLTVYNDTQDPGIYDVYADNFSNWFKITPAQFRLYPGDHKKVNLEITPKKIGSLLINISVVSRSLNRSSFNAASGLKIPLTLEVSKNNSISNFWYYIIAVIFFLLGFIFIFFMRKTFWQKTVDNAEEGINWLLHHNEKWYHKLIRKIKRKL